MNNLGLGRNIHAPAAVPRGEGETTGYEPSALAAGRVWGNSSSHSPSQTCHPISTCSKLIAVLFRIDLSRKNLKTSSSKSMIRSATATGPFPSDRSSNYFVQIHIRTRLTKEKAFACPRSSKTTSKQLSRLRLFPDLSFWACGTHLPTSTRKYTWSTRADASWGERMGL